MDQLVVYFLFRMVQLNFTTWYSLTAWYSRPLSSITTLTAL